MCLLYTAPIEVLLIVEYPRLKPHRADPVEGFEVQKKILFRLNGQRASGAARSGAL